MNDPLPQIISTAVADIGSNPAQRGQTVYALCARECETVELQLLPQRWGIPCGCGEDSELTTLRSAVQRQVATTMPAPPTDAEIEEFARREQLCAEVSDNEEDLLAAMDRDQRYKVGLYNAQEVAHACALLGVTDIQHEENTKRELRIALKQNHTDG